MVYGILADAVLVLHLLFVVFVVLGGAWVVRRPRLAWLHVPAFLWGVIIEFAGWVCPLTPLEQWLRIQAGEAGYSGGFLEHYLLRLLYPEGLGRGDQLLLGALVLGINLFWYGLLWWRLHTRT